jgi:hypothetical protein
MHVYLREEPIELRMREVDSEGLVPEDSDLTAIAFYVLGNEAPSFRALLPGDTVEVLREALLGPVTLGVLAEEPDTPDTEIQAMVGLAVPVSDLDGAEPETEEEPDEPWKASVGNPEGWRGEEAAEEGEMPRTALLAFAPLVRLRRKFPLDFGDELADLLETALSGVTRPALAAWVDRMLGDL